MLAAGTALLAGLTVASAGAAPPPPAVDASGGALAFVERRGDYHLRHYWVPAGAFAVSDDGNTGATGSNDGSAIVWDLRDGRAIRVIATPHVNVWAVALSRDGRKLATAGGDGTVRAWDVRSGSELWSSKHDANELRFSPDGRRLIGRRLEEHRVWEASDGRFVWGGLHHGDPRRELSGYPGIVTPDGRHSIEIITTAWREHRTRDRIGESPSARVVKVIDLDSTAVVRDLSTPEDGAVALGVSPADDRVAILTGTELFVVDPASGRRIAAAARSIQESRANQNPKILLGQDSRFALTWDGTQMIGWDLSAGKQIWREAVEKWEPPPQLAGNETLLVSRFELCFGRRLSDGSTRWRRPACVGGAGAPSSAKVLIGRGPSALDVVDAATGTSLLPPPPAQGPTGAIISLTVSADGGRVAGLAEDRSAWVWDAAGGGRKLVDAPDPLWYPVARFLSDGRLAVINQTKETDHRRVYRYDVGRNAIDAVEDVAHKDRFGLASKLVGERVVFEEIHENDYLRTVVDLGGRARPYHLPRWHRSPGRPAEFNLRNEALNDAAVTSRLTRAYVDGNDNRLHAWDLRTGTLVAEAPAIHEFVAALVLAPDEKRLLVAYRKGPIVVRAASTLKELRRLDGPKQAIIGAAISPDGKLAVVAAFDGLFVWRLSNGERIATVDFSAAREAPWGLAFSPDGETLWVGTTLGNLHRFSLRR